MSTATEKKEREKRIVKILDVCGIKDTSTISSGSYGTVLRVKKNGQDKVLKVILWGEPSWAKYGIKFPSEVDATTRLVHPHIIRTERIVTENDCGGMMGYSLLMEYAPTPLETYLKGKPPEGARDIIALQILSALAYTHHNGILHMDISHGNIVIGPQGGRTLVSAENKRLPSNPYTDLFPRSDLLSTFSTSASGKPISSPPIFPRIPPPLPSEPPPSLSPSLLSSPSSPSKTSPFSQPSSPSRFSSPSSPRKQLSALPPPKPDMKEYPHAYVVDYGMSINVGDVKKPTYITHSAVTTYYRPPELLRNEYKKPPGTPIGVTYATDIWSAGVLIACIYGSYIKSDNDDSKTYFNNIMKALAPGGYLLKDLKHSRKDDLVDLLSGMLSPKPGGRITAREAINHPFFRGVSTSYKEAAPYSPPGSLIYFDVEKKGKYFTPPNVNVDTFSPRYRRLISVASAFPNDNCSLLFRAIDILFQCHNLFNDTTIHSAVRREVPAACYWISRKMIFKIEPAITMTSEDREEYLLQAEILVLKTASLGRRYAYDKCITLTDVLLLLKWIGENMKSYFLIDVDEMAARMNKTRDKSPVKEKVTIEFLNIFSQYDPL